MKDRASLLLAALRSAPREVLAAYDAMTSRGLKRDVVDVLAADRSAHFGAASVGRALCGVAITMTLGKGAFFTMRRQPCSTCCAIFGDLLDSKPRRLARQVLDVSEVRLASPDEEPAP